MREPRDPAGPAPAPARRFRRILVTGGAGFIGSRFVTGLLDGSLPGFGEPEVVVLDALTYAGNLTSLDPVGDSPRLRVVTGDICDGDVVAGAMAGADLVVHFAAESHVDRSIEDAGAFVRTNVLGTHTLLREALDAGPERFVHVSTDEVYGSIEEGSWPEDQPLSPNSPYAASKAASDLLALAFHRTHGLPVCVTRCSNNYGPYQYPEKVVPLFTGSLLDGGTVPLYGDGGNRRDWLHVDDHCRGLALVARGGRPGEVYNIGGGTELTNTELTERLLELCGADWSAVRRVPDRKGHDRRYSVDFGKISAELGYAPRVGIDEGLAETVRWYRENRAWWEPLMKGR
ncbi:dTDP-glucose 4,6-dehydratase [Streptomyces sp. HU2014]|uniref:dTDP-glucose 4,6-dehydratase n=1 Tax=Streptomyces albireticuli TaxID=1940 RepID=A0A1Z2KZ48_9ACTN|nr:MULTISPECIES: dTDP-glucose 4,6-dehydratase [Streptomyces]ARZ67322.1 putative NDP-glucose-4,6-dehydratase [Streptomyces albireticuli]UQI47366.1 dTDP-glucose 4,6-dehydratase [Streptomyces sp. HU2014]